MFIDDTFITNSRWSAADLSIATGNSLKITRVAIESTSRLTFSVLFSIYNTYFSLPYTYSYVHTNSNLIINGFTIVTLCMKAAQAYFHIW